MIFRGEQFDAERRQLVVKLVNCEFVARNDARGEDHRVALAQADIGMLAFRDARQRRARFALAAGAEIEHAVRRQFARPPPRR